MPSKRRPRGGGGGGGGASVPKRSGQAAGQRPHSDVYAANLPPGVKPKEPPELIGEAPAGLIGEAPAGDSASVSPNPNTVCVPCPEPHSACLVCYADDLQRHRGILPCGHDDICGKCHLRLRYLHSDKKCPVCKTVNEKVIVDADPVGGSAAADGTFGEGKAHKPFSSYELWGDELGSGYTFRDDVGMFFPTKYDVNDIRPLFSLGCNVKGCTFDNDSDTYINEAKGKQKREIKRVGGMQALNAHLRNEHRLTLCNLCYMAKRDFVSNLPRFTPSELKIHQTKGDGPSSGFTGHPLCEFCRPRRFYDITKLHEHLNKEHYKCHVCDKQGRQNQFFKNYESLSRHFEREHFLCQNPQCLGARFVVFENELDLRHHERTVHGISSAAGSKINLEFRYRRSSDNLQAQDAPREEDFQFGLDGEAFVPPDLPTSHDPRQESEPEITHAAHAERTEELRAEAAEMRESQRQRESAESFPVLGADAASVVRTGGALVGWTAEGRAGMGRRGKGKLTEDDFPSLSAGPTKKTLAAKARRSLGANRIRNTSGQSSTVQWSSSRPAVRGPPHVGMDNFPSFGSGAGIAINRKSNLSSGNFPSLDGATSGSGSSSYATANAYARNRNQQSLAPPVGTAHFPALGSSSASSASNQQASRKRLTGAQRHPSQEALNNVMQVPASMRVTYNENNDSGKVVVQEMKAALGPVKYKELKGLTNYYAAGEMTPDAYVDMTSALFDRGIDDRAFWKYMPNLIESCPNSFANAKAATYMENLRVATALQTQEDNVASRRINEGALSGYAASSYGRDRNSARPANSSGSKKKKNQWNTSGKAGKTGVRAKAPVVSVAAAAAREEVQGGTATKGMVQMKKEERKQKQEQSEQKQGGGKNGKESKKTKQKKKKDELRSLAFGGG